MVVLGLDIGGANLKAATADKQAVSVPFPLWKQPDKLPAALAELVGQFPDADELAVTMTGELCDCYETKREGVNAILDATEFAAKGRAVRVWSTDGAFVSVAASRANHLKVAAGNWHALATFAGRFAPTRAIMVDIGSTSTDIIPLSHGVPVSKGRTDFERLITRELVYAGVRRTPICALPADAVVCAELFATSQDVFVVLDDIPEDPECRNTADDRPLTLENSLSRLARMLGGDRESHGETPLVDFATGVKNQLVAKLGDAVKRVYYQQKAPRQLGTLIISGEGEFLARLAAESAFGDPPVEHIISLNDELGPTVSACAPAYAVAILATEQRP